jgi:hypothetical protein
MAEKAIERPNDAALNQLAENATERAALRVNPRWNGEVRGQTLPEAAAALGRDHDTTTGCRFETLVVFLGSNNALPAVTSLRLIWSRDDFRDLDRKGRYTVWRPQDFAAELAELVKR